jgi:hypothetical protein
MRRDQLTVVYVFIGLSLALSAFAQDKPANDLISGTWSGDWGPNASDRNGVTVNMKWDGKAITGTVNSFNAEPVSIQKGTFDPKTGAVHMEADAKRGAQVIHYVIDGKLEKNSMSGSWNHDNRKGDFKITKK